MKNILIFLLMLLAIPQVALSQGTASALPEGLTNFRGQTILQATNGRPVRQGRTKFGESFVIAKPGNYHSAVCPASTCATNVKASAGEVTGIQAFNSHSADVWLKLYNTAGVPTVGTDVPFKTFLIPHGLGFILPKELGMEFLTGISYAVTSGIGPLDTGVVTVDTVVINIDYR